MSRSIWTTAYAVAAKDLKIEWRTKTAFASSIVFAVLVLAIFYFSRDTTVVSELEIAPAALWVTFTFASMLGLNRAFLLEQEHRAIDGILVTPVPRTGVFVGKLLGNLIFVVVLELCSLPLFSLFFNVSILRELPALLAVTLMATFAFVTVGTLLSAMVVRTRFSELMLPILLLPFLVPPIIGAVQITSGLLGGRPLSEYGGWMRLLASFDIAFVVACLLLFDATVEE